MRDYDRIFVDGVWDTPSSDTKLTVRSPATLEIVGQCPQANETDVHRAVRAARRAFDEGAWSRLPMSERAHHLRALAAAIEARGALLDKLVPLESGIPRMFSSGSSSVPLLHYYADLGDASDIEEVRAGRPGASGPAIIRRCPAGVVAALTPWNGPVMQILMKLAPALMAGCSVVVKVAPETPLAAHELMQAVAETLPFPGVVNLLAGGADIGATLVRHPDVDRVSFTGSTKAGAEIAAACGHDLRRVNLELGGKSAGILLPDADLDTALPTLTTFGLFFNGEACSALTRVLVPAARHDEVVERIVAIVRSLPVGDPSDPSTFLGPLISERQRDIVEGYIAIGRDEGAKVATGGGRPEGITTGWFLEPTVLIDVDNSMRVAREEAFGPLLCVIPYDDVDDAVRIANDSPLGLAGGVFGPEDEATAVARRLRTGHVGINCQGQDWCFPFGGFRRSGIGREMGAEGLELYQELQCIGFPEGSRPATTRS
jgi:aldehyde dehydrogenase (NAD+)